MWERGFLGPINRFPLFARYDLKIGGFWVGGGFSGGLQISHLLPRTHRFSNHIEQIAENDLLIKINPLPKILSQYLKHFFSNILIKKNSIKYFNIKNLQKFWRNIVSK